MPCCCRFADQFDNGLTVARAKVGVALPQFTKVTATDLAAALEACLQPTVQAAAAELGAKLLAEDGLKNAGDVLFRFYDEEVRTGVFAKAFEKSIKERVHYRKKRLLAGGLLGGLHTTLFVMRVLLFGMR